MSKHPLEKAVISKFQIMVKSFFPEAFIWNFHQGPMSGAGFPDLLLVLDGLTLHLEAKRYGHKPSSKQERIMHNIRMAGGRCAILAGSESKTEARLIPWRNQQKQFVTLSDTDSKELFQAKLLKVFEICSSSYLEDLGREEQLPLEISSAEDCVGTED